MVVWENQAVPDQPEFRLRYLGERKHGPKSGVLARADCAITTMNALAEYIREGVERRGFRYVFDQRLDQVWPIEPNSDRKAQMEQVRQFADVHGWNVNFIREGRIAIFRRPRPGKKGGSTGEGPGSNGDSPPDAAQ